MKNKLLTIVTLSSLILGSISTSAFLLGCDSNKDKYEKTETKKVDGNTVTTTEEKKVDRTTGEGYHKKEVKVDKDHPENPTPSLDR